jgi:hypothetical protein
VKLHGSISTMHVTLGLPRDAGGYHVKPCPEWCICPFLLWYACALDPRYNVQQVPQIRALVPAQVPQSMQIAILRVARCNRSSTGFGKFDKTLCARDN